MKIGLKALVLTRLAKAYSWRTTLLSGIAALTALGTIAMITQPSYAQRNRFFCDTVIDGRGRSVPATLAHTPGQGNVPMILWVRNDFQGRYTRRHRCQEVAARFQRHYENRTLRFIRTGTVNQYPVLCIASEKGGSCPKDQVLITLSLGTDPKVILAELLDLRRRSSNRPLYLSGNGVVVYVENETYVDVEKLLQIPAVESVSSPPSKAQPSSQVEPLWEM